MYMLKIHLLFQICIAKQWKIVQRRIWNWFLPSRNLSKDFPGSPVVKTSPSNSRGAGLIPGQEAKITHASGPKKPKHKTEAIL